MTIAKETQEIIKAAKAASTIALREAKALDLVVRIIVKGIIYDQYPNGGKIKVGEIEKLPTSNLKNGMVLQLKDEQA